MDSGYDWFKKWNFYATGVSVYGYTTVLQKQSILDLYYHVIDYEESTMDVHFRIFAHSRIISDLF